MCLQTEEKQIVIIEVYHFMFQFVDHTTHPLTKITKEIDTKRNPGPAAKFGKFLTNYF